MSEMEDRRGSARRVYHVPILIDMMVSDFEYLTNVAHEAAGVDISQSGLGLFTSYHLLANDVLRLHIRLKPDKTSLPVFAKVVWAKPVQERFRAGLSFLV